MKSELQIVTEKIAAVQESFNVNSDKFIAKGNQAAGRRARKDSLELAKLYKEFRKLSTQA